MPKVEDQECLEALAKVRTFCQQRNFTISIHDSLGMPEKKRCD